MYKANENLGVGGIKGTGGKKSSQIFCIIITHLHLFECDAAISA
jgi:hypothetical protein